MCEKVGKARFFFRMVCGSQRSKSRLAKATGAESSCQMRDEKLHVILAGSTCPRQNVQDASCSEHSWKLRCRKSARPYGKMYQTHFTRTTCGRDVEKVHAAVVRSKFPSQRCKKLMGSEEHFLTFRCRFAWQAQRILHLVKSEQNVMVL